MKQTMSPTTTTADTTKARTTITIAATIPLWSPPVPCWGSSVPDERVADDTDEDLGLTGTFLVVAAAMNVGE